MADPCSHAATITAATPSGDGCSACLRTGSTWVTLRRCTTCGNVGCCDSSPNRHATTHFHETGHPVMQSFEPGQDWFWCYLDTVSFTRPGDTGSPSHS